MKPILLVLLLAGAGLSGCDGNDDGPAPIDTNLQEINRLRTEIEDSWKNYSPADGQVDTVRVGKGDVKESPDGVDEHVCEFKYDQADFRFTWDAPNRISHIFRDLLNYQLGAATNVPAATCAQVANRNDDFAFLGFAVTAEIFLNLDKLKDQNPKELDEVRPTRMAKQTFQTYDVYHLTYFIKGRATRHLPGLQSFMALDDAFEGTLEATFATKAPVAAWLWQVKWDLTVNGQPAGQLERNALAINGVALPIY